MDLVTFTAEILNGKFHFLAQCFKIYRLTILRTSRKDVNSEEYFEGFQTSNMDCFAKTVNVCKP